VETYPENAELWNALAAAFAELGRTSEAIQHFQRALAIDPDHQEAKENLERLRSGQP
jgi:Flp pilus assembly protein TadD